MMLSALSLLAELWTATTLESNLMMSTKMKRICLSQLSNLNSYDLSLRNKKLYSKKCIYNRSTRETVKPLHAWPNGIKGWGDTSTFNSSAIFSHTLVGWAQLPPSIYTREERGLTSSHSPAHTLSLIRYTPLSNLVQPTVFVYLECPIPLLVQIPYSTLFQLGPLKLLSPSWGGRTVWAPCMGDPSPWWASSGGSLLGGGSVAQ